MTTMKATRRDILLVLAGLGISGSAPMASAASARSDTDLAGGKVVFENDKVRVIEHVAKPRLGVCGMGLHSHPPHLTVFLTDAKAKVTLAGKDAFLAENKAGDVFWDPGGAHAVENLGSRSTRVFLVELKQG
jgi:quercetin dioxygenase-like cupin family protein